ncbi:restriction endonuclease fold toxin 5 of polymorphic toxin system [Roseiarcus fermentans]|uniref:Restriction endonuclease fold toxin 5 of polymorphic toxin system n=1 Tax=Roseiarcus fermentans TaxID=1473586 RepID=A0A366ERZ2_9HYPH|nr:Tox-REase-5 domain-containing protein [Roseiarcus fermentans]RBP05158.1 restriction endonuclease fold toxin 5 of polymorphic toxin system [Roseiarcus fermentans]
MNPVWSIPMFRLAPRRVECDDNGLRVAGTPLLKRGAHGTWAVREEGDVGRELQKLYGFPLDVGCKRGGLAVIARALNSGDLARAQVATLLLKLPDPPATDGAVPDALQKRRLAHELTASGLLKTDDDWDAEHPRTGTPPNPGWFATKPGAVDPPKADVKPVSPSAAAGAAVVLRPLTAAAEATALIAPDIAPAVLEALGTLGAAMAGSALAAFAAFGAIFVPSANRLLETGSVPGRSDISYRWDHDVDSVTFSALVDGEWRPLTSGTLHGNAFLDEKGKAVAVSAPGPDGRQTLVTSVEVLDRAVAELKSGAGSPDAAQSRENHEPRLCPDPTPEPKTTKSENSIRYQEYVSGLPYGLAIDVGGVRFDGCDPTTGDLLEAKADIDHLFDDDGELKVFVNSKKDPIIQMQSQIDVAFATIPPRRVVWHAQTPKGFQGLSVSARRLERGKVFVVYDPNGGP